MDGTTGGRCQASYAIRVYHHKLKEIFTIFYDSSVSYATPDGDSASD